MSTYQLVGIFGHSADVAKDIEEAKKIYAPGSTWSSESLALHIQAVIQGSFILAKSDQNAAIAAESIAHLRRYIEFLFHPPISKKKVKEKE